MASHATGDGGIPPRDAGKRGLTRIMTLGGAYGTRNYTVKGLRDQKGKRVLCETLPFSTDEAAAAEEAGIDTMKVRFDPKSPGPAAAIRAARQTRSWRFRCRCWRLQPPMKRCGLAMTRWRSVPMRSCVSGARGLSRQPRRRAFRCKGTRAWCRAAAPGPAGCAPLARRLMRRCGFTTDQDV